MLSGWEFIQTDQKMSDVRLLLQSPLILRTYVHMYVCTMHTYVYMYVCTCSTASLISLLCAIYIFE